MKKSNKFLALFALGMVYGTMYNLPYTKYVFYDAMVEAMGITNAQVGSLLAYYALACIITYIPGGWLADKFAPKKILTICGMANGALCIFFAFTLQSYLCSILVWILCALTGSAAFWAAIIKAVRVTGGENDQGSTFGIFEAFCGFAATLSNFGCIFVFSHFSDPVLGFKGAIIAMGVMSICGALLVSWLYKEKKLTDNAESGGEDDRLTLAAVGKLLKMPQVYLASLIVFTVYSVYSGQSMLNPYFTNVLGATVVFSGSLSVIRSYGLKLVGGPLGGIVADKLGSICKLMIGGSIISMVLIAAVLFFPGGGSSAITILTAISLLLAAVNFMMKGTMFASVSEVNIPIHLTGSAVGIVTLLGWLPDTFMSTMFGSWIDQYGNAGYDYIFYYLIGMCVLCIITSLLIIRNKKKTAVAAVSNAA